MVINCRERQLAEVSHASHFQKAMAESNYQWDMAGRPIVDHRTMIDFKSDCIKMAALGRRFRLGQFYDYRTDTVFTGRS